MTNDPAGNDFNKLLSDTVERIKENDKFRSDYAAMNLHDYDITTMAKEVGIEEGARNKAIEAAENLLKLNKLSEEEIAQTIGLPIEQVLKLKEKITVPVQE